MRVLLLKLLNKLSMKVRGLPSRAYVKYLLIESDYTWPSRNKSTVVFFQRQHEIIRKSLAMYGVGNSLSEIQTIIESNYREKLTKERIRQYTFKFVREAEKKL